ncbi:chemokine (C-C motif) ligand 35, duplicate 1 [Misgurnus anguillicaudatus]|uniref:chemokine (C-C motif) ligand 35, duplicate 1 n=1 Tax=Misgurnus anguillicaudatus TaxID=75329 RepID=UPI0024356A4B|nr:chemokine (C-C motif) ligand 35, duplicate 1 [Misgurnus anguillicaudatus]
MTASRLVVFSAILMILGAITISEGMRIGPKRCCFSFQSRQVPIKQIIGYSMTSQQCPMQAVLFKTKRGSQICANPTDSWVQKHMETFNSKPAGAQGTL